MSAMHAKSVFRAVAYGLGVMMMLVASSRVEATSGVVGFHTTDGDFTTPSEWDTTRPTVAVINFPVVGNTGGANLFVEQQGGVLYLMYDYLNSNTLGFTKANAAFDVFFQVPNDKANDGSKGSDYVVRMTATGSSAFEKPTDKGASSTNPDGSINVNDPIWTPLGADDLARAGFKTALGFGHDPATPSVPDHLLAEFQLNLQSPKNPGGGFYSPEPAFWSASVKGATDPPISSGIFMLNPDGTTIVHPAFGPNGGPAQQPQDVSTITPEPASLALVALGMAIVAIRARRKGRPADHSMTTSI